MIESRFFEHCCGAVEIGNLNGTSREIERGIRGVIEDHQTGQAIGDDSPGMLVATTVPVQRSAVTALRRLKFRQVLTSVNPGTGNEVTLWAKKLTYKK